MPPATVAEFLEQHNLATYTTVLGAKGWDDLSQLQAIDESDLQKLITDVDMLSGHVARLRNALGKTQPAAPLAQPQPPIQPPQPPQPPLSPQPPPPQLQPQMQPTAPLALVAIDAVQQAKLQEHVDRDLREMRVNDTAYLLERRCSLAGLIRSEASAHHARRGRRRLHDEPSTIR